MKKEYTPFGLYFSNLRKSRKQTITEAASLLGVSISYISSVEHGDREIPHEWIEKIANIYNLNEQDKNELVNAYRSTPSSTKISISILEQSMTNMFNSIFEGEEREKALKELKRRFDELKENKK